MVPISWGFIVLVPIIVLLGDLWLRIYRSSWFLILLLMALLLGLVMPPIKWENFVDWHLLGKLL